ncbi:hypothetical protein ACFLTA_05790 [Bacteroidota bacterium]
MINGSTNISHWRYFRIPGIIFLVILIISGSCIKEEFNPDAFDPTLQINPGVAAPIGWVRYQLDEMLTDSLAPDELLVDQNGFITLVYKQDLYSLQASDLLSINDFSAGPLSFRNNTGLPIDLNALPPGMPSFSDTLSYSMPITGTNGAEIDSIVFRDGDITVSAITPFTGMEWDAKISIIGVSSWGITLDETNTSVTNPLDGVTVPFNNTPPASNEIGFAVQFTIIPSSGIINVGQNIITFNITIAGIEFSVIYGYLGQFQVDVGPQSFAVNFFEKLQGGTFHFHQPKLTLGFQNSFGLPLGISLSDFYATGKNGEITSITGPVIPTVSNPKILAYPHTIQEGSIDDSLVLTPQNTNLFTILETSPTEVTVEVNGTTNPAGPPADNFIMDTSSLAISTELRLPMEGYADILLIADTLDFALGDLYDAPDEIKQLIFRLNFDHSFPVDLSLQIIFTDENYMALDSLFHDANDLKRVVVGSDNFDANGKAQPVVSEPVEVVLTSEQIENITDSQYIIINGRVKTTGADSKQNVKFFADYYFRAFIGAIAELEINSDDL